MTMTFAIAKFGTTLDVLRMESILEFQPLNVA
jgi:hypothetical protein